MNTSAAIQAKTQAQDIARSIADEDHGGIPATVLADAIAALLDRAGAALEGTIGGKTGFFDAAA